MSKKYTEIHVLKDRLREAGIPYEVQKANDGWQVGIPHLYPRREPDQRDRALRKLWVRV